MKNTAFARRLLVALSLIAAPGAAARAASGPAAGAAAATVRDNPASHPTFMVRVVGKGRPMLLIPGP